MDSTWLQRQVSCTTSEWFEHLCYMRAQGFHLEDETGYMALIMAPKFHCGHCGRQAASERSLCVPSEEDK